MFVITDNDYMSDDNFFSLFRQKPLKFLRFIFPCPSWLNLLSNSIDFSISFSRFLFWKRRSVSNEAPCNEGVLTLINSIISCTEWSKFNWGKEALKTALTYSRISHSGNNGSTQRGRNRHFGSLRFRVGFWRRQTDEWRGNDHNPFYFFMQTKS